MVGKFGDGAGRLSLDREIALPPPPKFYTAQSHPPLIPDGTRSLRCLQLLFRIAGMLPVCKWALHGTALCGCLAFIVAGWQLRPRWSAPALLGGTLYPAREAGWPIMMPPF
jgi:hypothetical protein